ncbi:MULTISPECIES: hypothetical protein [unclassified Streptomyces]|nr:MULTISPECIES: hypothetical protein [unclassified Streptomyces]MYT30146.1 hypothetical protein [Streptomyces sp. SID8354]
MADTTTAATADPTYAPAAALVDTVSAPDHPQDLIRNGDSGRQPVENTG